MRSSKSVILFTFIFLSFLGFSQDNDAIEKNATAYRNLTNYIPTHLRSSETQHPINTILTMWMHNDLVSSETDRKLMDQVIKQLATEFFTDGKMVLLRNVGGYLGCPDKSVDTIYRNTKRILEVPLCGSCNDIAQNRHMIEVFNTKMYELMQIDPPTEKTKVFYGEYKGFDKNKHPLKLILKEDRSFQFWRYPKLGSGSDYTDGLWKHQNDTLILTSKNLKGLDSIATLLQSGRRIDFNNLTWKLKKSKLQSMDTNKWKLKKEN